MTTPGEKVILCHAVRRLEDIGCKMILRILRVGMLGLVTLMTMAVLLTVAQFARAQSSPHFSLHMIDRYAFNPAFAGLEASLSITGNYRTQWLGIAGNPVQQYVSAHMPFYLWQGAIGMAFHHESIGARKQLSGTVSYNYVMETYAGLLSVGLSAGFIQQTLDGSLLRTPDGDYEGPVITHHDPILPNGTVQGIAPLFHAGVYFAGDLFEGGLSVMDLQPSAIRLDGVHVRNRTSVILFGEYFIENLGPLRFYPSLYVQTDLVQLQPSIAVRAEYESFITAGAGLRGYNANTLDAVLLFGGIRISEHLRLYYAYDLTLSSLRRGTEGSHEVMLRYNMRRIVGAGLRPPVIYSPRY